MISLATLCEQIQSKLNGNTEGKKFKIFSDTGDYLKAVRAGNTVTETINGLAQVVQSSITPTQGLVVATQQVRLEFAFPVEEYNIPLGTDETVTVKTVEEITEEVRDIYDNTFQTVFREVMTDGSEDTAKTFVVTILSSPLSTGERNQRQVIGDSMTLVAYLDFSFVQNGVSSFDCPVKLNGMELPYTVLAIDRTPAAEANAYSNSDGVAKTRILSTALSVRVVMPANDDSEAWTAIKAYLLNTHAAGDPSPAEAKYTLSLCLGDKDSSGQPAFTDFTVYIADTAMNVNSGEYIGLTVNFVEAVNYGSV